MNYQPWLEFIAVLLGSIFGAYLAVRVTLARIEEQIKAHEDKIDSHDSRLNRLEASHFTRGR